MYYINLEKLQEFVDMYLPTDAEYAATSGITERMVLDERKKTITAMCNFINKHQAQMGSDNTNENENNCNCQE